MTIVTGVALLCTASALLYGGFILSNPIEGKPVRISVVQGNIPQDKKWDRRYAKAIMETYIDLTRQATKDRPDLIVWPETATPGAINGIPGLIGEVNKLRMRPRIPLLLGSARQQKIKKKNQGPSNT